MCGVCVWVCMCGVYVNVYMFQFDIKLDGLSVIHRSIGRAMFFDSRAQFFFKLIARPICLCIMRKNPSNFIIIMF